MLSDILLDQEWNPFVGPRPFKREERGLFFGREYESEKIISLIYSHRVVLLYAQSGAGKTSVFNASITPLLEERGLQVLPQVRIRVGSHDTETTYTTNSVNEINRYIFNIIESLALDIDDKHLLEIKSLSEFLHKYFPHRVNERESVPQVIIFDQLEELFNLYSDPYKWHEHQEGFFKEIADALDKDPLLRTIFIIREDYLAQLDPFANFLPGKLKSRFRLERLRKDAAFEAINGPLERAKAHLEPRAVDRLFDEHIVDRLVEDLLKIRVETFGGQFREIQGEFVEPIQLQLVCQRLWNKLKTSQVSQITQDDFGYLGDVDKALEDFYLEAICKASKQTGISEGAIRKWFEEKLITSSGTRGVVHRGVRTSGGIPNSVTDILENKYLIRREKRSGAQWYELTHDRLIEPITDSNAKWKNERKKKRLVLKIAIPSSIVITVLTCMVIFNLFNLHHAELRTSIGDEPSHVYISPSTNIGYVVNSGSNTVSVIDGKTNKVISNITVGNWPYALSGNPSSNRVYVANLYDNTVSVIDGKTNSVIASITVGNNPFAVSVNPSTNRVYAVNAEDSTVSVIDGKTNSVIATIPLGKSTYSESVSVNPSTNRVYVANSHDNTVSVIDGKTNKVIATIPAGKGPFRISVNPSTNRIYVVNKPSNAVSVIDGKTNSVIATIPAGKGPDGISVNPLTNIVYVANEVSNTVSVIDGNINTIITNIPTDAAPDGISVNPSNNRVYVANYDGNTVSVIDGKTNSVTATIHGNKLKPKGIHVDSGPDGISVNPSTNLAYVANVRDNTVSVIDGKTNAGTATVKVGTGPWDISINPSTNRVYVVNEENNTVSVIDGKTNSVIDAIPVGNVPRGIFVNPSTNLAYVANYHD
ncbi:MAG: beta-propeller fold lactonase family protein, partial [Candidatus Nitrosopolaris sp.]